MKKIFTLLTILFGVVSISTAQNVLLSEDFNVDNGLWVETAPSGNDGPIWINFDEDGIPDANARPGGWYWSDPVGSGAGFVCDADSTAGGVMQSSSWLQNFDPNSKNWLISPAVSIDSGATLSWKSASFQTPLYLDGYSVWISTTDNLELSFTDMVFEAAEFVSTGTDSLGTGDYSLYEFTGPVTGGSAWIHGADGTYIELDSTDLTRNSGCLAPHSVDLSNYNGQTIYVAFLHGSHDDNLIAVDDITITGYGSGVSVEETTNFNLEVFPNPATDNFKLTYQLEETSYVDISLYDNTGKLIETYNKGTYMAGSHAFTADVTKLPAGFYSIVIKSDNFTTSKQLIIQ